MIAACVSCSPWLPTGVACRVFYDLRVATLIGADLSKANLSFANLNDADLTGANLSDVVGWSTVTLEGVRGCDTATEPRPLLPGC